MKLFLLDAYALIYRAYYGLIKNPRINSRGENVSAIYGFFNTLEEVLAKEQPTHIGVAFDPHGGTFRHKAYPPYKAQREETPEAIRFGVPVIKDILASYHIPVLEIEGYEADDVIGTLATQAEAAGISTFMMTPDKDYGQLVSPHVVMFKPKNMGVGFDVLGPAEVCAKWGIDQPSQVIDILGLMGDASDNIPGCPGVGEKTAVTLVQQFGNIANLLEHTDQLKGKLKERVEENREQITLSRWLAQIVTDVPITLDLDMLAYREPDRDALIKQFSQLEMRSLINRKFGGDLRSQPSAPDKPAPKEKPADAQLDLFGEPIAPSTSAPTATPAAKPVVEPTEAALQPDEQQPFTTYADSGAQYHLVDTPAARADLIRHLLAADEMAMDTETTPTAPIDAELVGLSFAVTEGEAYYVPIPEQWAAAQAIVDEFRPVYEHKSILKIGQNIKYDIVVLRNYGIHLTGPMWDTMIAHYLIQPELHHGMDYLAEIYLNYQTIHIEELIGPKGKNQRSMRDVDINLICNYAAEDADITLRLKNKLEPELKKFNCEKLFYNIEIPLMSVLAEMEINGVCIDTESLKETSKAFTLRMKEMEDEIYELAGEEFNISSPKQVGDILFGKLKIINNPKKTKTWQYVTSEDVLSELVNKNEIVGKILEYRKLKNELSKQPKAKKQRIKQKETSNLNMSLFTERDIIEEDPYTVMSKQFKRLEQEIYVLAGEKFNISSPKKVGEILFDKLKIVDNPKKSESWQFVTNEEILQQLKGKHRIVEIILAHREMKKLLGTYVDALPDLINKRTGHVHTSFNQTITATGRLSSSNPNLQNIPVRGEDGKEIRKAFIPEPGCLFFSADYSQIELRVMAHLSGDENMVNVFKRGKDLHAATAATIYNKNIEEVSRDERTKSKRANFGIIYGITAFGLAERLNISREESKKLIDGFFETFPKVKDYMDNAIQEARQKEYVETLFGRRRYLKDINSANGTVRGFAERNAINAPIQGSAADIIKVAMIRIFNRFKKDNIRSKMILQVHDELNFSVYPEEKDIVEKIVLDEMQNVLEMRVPLVADSGFGKNWLEAH